MVYFAEKKLEMRAYNYSMFSSTFIRYNFELKCNPRNFIYG